MATLKQEGADRASLVLKKYKSVQLKARSSICEDDAVRLLADLRHLCAKEDWVWPYVVDASFNIYMTEGS